MNQMNMKKLLITGMLLVIVQVTNAQHINNVFAFKTEKKHSMMLNLEFDPALFWGITYNRSFNVRLGSFERKLTSQIGWKTFQFNYNDLNLNFQTTLLYHQAKSNVILNFGAENKYLENKVHQVNVYNWIVSMMPGYFTERWYVGTELHYKWLFKLKYDHTDFYKEVFPQVQDGWYAYKNAYGYLSLNAGAKLSENMDIDLRAGYRFSSNFTNYQPYIQPYFANMAINFRF